MDAGIGGEERIVGAATAALSGPALSAVATVEVVSVLIDGILLSLGSCGGGSGLSSSGSGGRSAALLGGARGGGLFRLGASLLLLSSKCLLCCLLLEAVLCLLPALCVGLESAHVQLRPLGDRRRLLLPLGRIVGERRDRQAHRAGEASLESLGGGVRRRDAVLDELLLRVGSDRKCVEL